MELSVEGLCNQLARHRLLDGAAIRALRGQWRGEAGMAADSATGFRAWLARGCHVSVFQLDMLEKGHGDFLRFGEYTLQDRIGTGRMAGIYKAVHPSGQTIAIKILPPSQAKKPQILGRFLREARLATRLDHDNIVRTFQHGIHKDMHYIVMEYLEGDTLEETLQRRGRLPFDEAASILAQALEGLDYLQDIGFVHRDLKPANLMLLSGASSSVAPGGAGQTTCRAVKILDIGLGRALFDDGELHEGEAANLTTLGALVGTLDYMAPEQARSAHTADIRADIYSLGCVMYEMLVGQPPFPDANFALQMRRHAEENPKPLTDLVPGLAPAADALVQKMLAKDPALRYAVPRQALKDVKALANSVPAAMPVKPNRSYLTWLETQPKDEAPAPVAQYESVVPPAMPALPPIPPATREPSPSIPFALPVALPVAAPVTPATPVTASPSRAQSEPTEELPETIPPLILAKAAWHRIRAFGWARRDWIAAAVGAGALLLVLLLLWLLRII